MWYRVDFTYFSQETGADEPGRTEIEATSVKEARKRFRRELPGDEIERIQPIED